MSDILLSLEQCTTELEITRSRLKVAETHIAELMSVLKLAEWGGSDRDQDHRPVRACPICKRIDPSDHMKSGFIREWHDHASDCKLKAVLDSSAYRESKP